MKPINKNFLMATVSEDALMHAYNARPKLPETGPSVTFKAREGEFQIGGVFNMVGRAIHGGKFVITAVCPGGGYTAMMLGGKQ